MLQVERPPQKSGRKRQYRKHLTTLLKSKELTTGMMMDRVGWAEKLTELYPRDNQKLPKNPNFDNTVRTQISIIPLEPISIETRYRTQIQIQAQCEI